MQVPLLLHVVESTHTTKKTLHYLEFGKNNFSNLQQVPGLTTSSMQQLPGLAGSSMLVPVQRHCPALFESSKQQPTTKVKSHIKGL